MDSSRHLDPRQEKRLLRAVSHVSDYWFPVNERLLSEIRSELDGIDGDEGLASIVQKIQADQSLFFHCLKELSSLVSKEGEGSSRDPVMLLHDAGIEELRRILDPENGKISVLSYDSGSTEQLARFHETLVSATTAQTLAESYGVDESAAYSSAMLRQLGLTLIAWNYPGVYHSVVSDLQSDDSIDARMSAKLGFSPHLLAIRLLESWGLSSDYSHRLGLIDELAAPRDPIAIAMADTLAELCRVGECLARAHHPEIYPSARSDWEFAQREVTSRIGEDGIRIIKEKLDDVLEVYNDFMPEVFDHGLDGLYELTENYDSYSPIDRDLERNPFLSCCKPEVSRSIRTLYRSLENITDAAVSVRAFADNVIPTARFSGGAIYTADPSIMMLIPQFSFGDMQLRLAHGVDYSLVLSNADLVALAYQNAEPVVEFQMSQDSQVITAIAGMFGGTQRVGVLYLEIPEMVSDFVRDEQVL
ncbi:MAG: HDOD domain-containing protein, partial [Bdellovibrionales bacterium]|nr:HDOD domain-containing protein [Bdellovibrionales bacterium]